MRNRSRSSSRAVLVLLHYVMGPAPMELQFWPGAIFAMTLYILPPQAP